MIVDVLKSSSAGNGYLLTDKDESLAIEAGVKFPSYLPLLDYNIDALKGLLVSHEHGDHAKHVKQFLERGIHVYLSEGTKKHIEQESGLNRFPHLVHTVTAGNAFRVGGFWAMPFKTIHDAAEPLGFAVMGRSKRITAFATDTRYLPCKIPKVETWLIECNYSEAILTENVENGTVHPAQAQRVRESHMSLETCKRALAANDLRDAQNIILIHLSSRNSNAKEFQTEIERQTGIATYVAETGLRVETIE